MIPLRMHNIIDYVWGLAALFAPYVFGFDFNYAARDSFVFIGALVIIYSLISDYFYSPVKLLPINLHLFLDLLCAALVTAAPLIFDYQSALSVFQYMVHLAFGATLIGSVVLATHVDAAKLLKTKTAADIKNRTLKDRTPVWRSLTLKH